jgi:hypothetical protein
MTKKQIPFGEKLSAQAMKGYKGGWWDHNLNIEDWLNNFGCQTAGTCSTYLDCTFTTGCQSPVPLYIDCVDCSCVILQGYRP